MDTKQTNFIESADAQARSQGLPAYSALLKVTQEFVAQFGPTVDADAPLRGCDAVDGVVNAVSSFRAALI